MWIARDFERAEYLPVFLKRFTLKKQIKGCEMKISALGIFSVKINGIEIKEYFMPGWSNYNKSVHLLAYDITKYLKKDNLIEVTLADGWYSGKLGYTRQSCVYGSINALYADISINYVDETKENLSTDESWRVAKSNIVSSSFFDGETIDFRADTAYCYDKLPFAKRYETERRFIPYSYGATVEIDYIKPAVVYKDGKVIRLDFKQNFAGFLSFVAEGKEGSQITVRHAEVLDSNGELYTENLRQAKATDKIILSGGKDFFKPKFTYHGFRYAQIEIDGNAKIKDIKGVVLSQDIRYHGKFKCSDGIINSVYKNALWGQKSNFISIPTDCPQRDERLGWTGDTQVFCNSAMFNGDCDKFIESYLQLLREDVLPDGKIPSFVPFFIPVSDSSAGVPGWADSICVIPYVHYLHYKNKQVLRDCLPYAIRHVEYYRSKCEGDLLKLKNPFGDWLSVERADDIEAINQCFYGLSLKLLSKMLLILEEDEKAKEYSLLYKGAKEAFKTHYMSDNRLIQGDSQTIYALSLYVGFVSCDEIRQPFIRSIEKANGKLTTGFIGVRHLLPSLCDIGEVDLAYKIIKQTEYPSWGYTVKNGATTIWERWNGYTEEKGFETPSMNSFNHYSLGSCVEWLYSYVLGIKLSEDDCICISPSFSGEIDCAKGEYTSIYGKIAVEWRKKGQLYKIKIKFDKGVNIRCDFSGRQVLSRSRRKNSIFATLK